MEPRGAAAAAVFVWTFVILATGRIGRHAVSRGVASLAGGLTTAMVLAIGPDAVDPQVIALLAGLMVLAALAEEAGLFAGLRRHLVHLEPWLALWASLALVAVASAILLNDAAVVVLVPFLLPALGSLGIPLVAAATLVAVAANLGSLLTPFGNPQNAVLARHAGLSTIDFLVAQGPLVAGGLLLLGAASWVACRRLGEATAPPPHVEPRGRPWIVLCILAFLVLAAFGPVELGLGGAALACAAVGWFGLRLRIRGDADRAARRGFDLNVLALFVGLYYLTAGLPAWFPSDKLPLASLHNPASAAAVTTLLSNLVGNVPAMLMFVSLDGAWTATHAMFLVTVSTLGGALLLTGSAASLIAADQARKLGVEVRFAAFARHALWVLPLLLVGAWLTWPH